jgi:hypothetical protein
VCVTKNVLKIPLKNRLNILCNKGVLSQMHFLREQLLDIIMQTIEVIVATYKKYFKQKIPRWRILLHFRTNILNTCFVKNTLV